MTDERPVGPQLDPIFRAEYGRTVASVIRRVGDISLAEDAVSEAIVAALQTWPARGIPPNPGAWLTTTAHRKAVDRLRRDSLRDHKHAEAELIQDRELPPDAGPIADDRLRLIFTCCHPVLALDAQIALTLRLLGGLTIPEIARAFLIGERTLAQRITRAKRKITEAGVPYRVPEAEELPTRLAGVLRVLYLIFNEGYLASDGQVIRDDLAVEAVRLTRELATMMPTELEVRGLLALELLALARRPARIREGALVPIDEQDRARWDRAMITEGHGLVRACLAADRPGPYQIQAAINAVHTDAERFEVTRWDQIVTLYDQLLVVAPSPVVSLNRAIAVAEVDGAQVGLAEVERLNLSDYADWHAARADLLVRLERRREAAQAYRSAIEASTNPAQRAFLEPRMSGCRDG